MSAFAQSPIDESLQQDDSAKLMTQFFLDVQEIQQQYEVGLIGVIQSIEVASNSVQDEDKEAEFEEGVKWVQRVLTEKLEALATTLIEKLEELGISLRVQFNFGSVSSPILSVTLDMGAERNLGLD